MTSSHSVWRRSGRAWLALLALFIAEAASPAAEPPGPAGPAPPAELRQQVRSVLEEAQSARLSISEAVRRLCAMGPEIADALAGEPVTHPAARLARDRALIELGRPEPAAADLLAWAKSEAPLEERLTAATALADAAAVPGTDQQLLTLMKHAREPPLRIALARALWLAARSEGAQLEAAAALQHELRSKEEALRRQAALALAELGEFSPEVREQLQQLQHEPDAPGRLARSLLREADLTDRLLHPSAWKGSLGAALLDEIRSLLKQYHVSPPLPEAAYVHAAARGLAELERPGDPFTEYFDPAQWQEFQEQVGSTYAGIGVQLGPVKQPGQQEPVPTILRVLFDEPAPAFRAGLRAYDQVVAIDGKLTEKMGDEEISAAIRGEPDTLVKLSVLRSGWSTPREFAVKRAQIRIATARGELLPGGVGYVRLSSFSDETSGELEEVLRGLERQPLRALILDLRDNPGGRLDSVVEVADKFLKDNKLIATSAGRNPEIAPKTEYRTTDPATHPDYPIVCLVNGQSASAAELLSGALQDQRRAILVGERTYGKGSVQQTMPLRSLGGRGALKITIAEYFLPSGRSIHHKGVEPDVAVPEAPPEFAAALEKLRLRGLLDRYWEEHSNKQAAVLEQLAQFDAADAEGYPGFDEWFAAVREEISRSDARAALRQWIRLRLEEQRGREFLVDLQEDRQLQRALYELAQRVPEVRAEKVALYEWLFPQIDKALRAEKPKSE